jgi:ubiquinone/menaquinone biosynthesis C-methylase UbiE
MEVPRVILIAHRMAAMAVGLALWCVLPATVATQAANDTADAARLIDVLQLRPGAVVADIGAGSGLLTVPVARAVGPTGRVYATDVNPQRLDELRKAAIDAALQNVVVLAGAGAGTNLPDACCDAVFMRNVYHHFSDPPAFNASLFRSLRPGGRLAVADFSPTDGRSAPAGSRDSGDAHGVAPATVADELTAAGFIGVERVDWPSAGGFLVIARRP